MWLVANLKDTKCYGITSNPPDKLCIDTIHRARRAALQTTFGLGRILGRDVARMIGKMVYETRNDSVAWWKKALCGD